MDLLGSAILVWFATPLVGAALLRSVSAYLNGGVDAAMAGSGVALVLAFLGWLAAEVLLAPASRDWLVMPRLLWGLVGLLGPVLWFQHDGTMVQDPLLSALALFVIWTPTFLWMSGYFVRKRFHEYSREYY